MHSGLGQRLGRALIFLIATAAFAANGGTAAAATVPGAPTGVSASPATAQALVSWTAPSSNGGSPLTGYTITVTPQGGSASQVAVNSGSASSAVVSGLTNGTSYTFTVAATNAIGTGTASSASAAITPNNTILDFPTPQTLDSGDATSVNLGIEFTASQNGSVTGVRFYKAAANTGTHVGSLWSSSGQLLAQGTFTNETASGWQTLVFSSPVSITAGSTYIASYLAPSGHFSMTRPGFSTALTNGPLTAPASTSTTYGNGVFAYSATSAFPTSSYQATDYGVDVLFNPGGGGTATVPGAPTGVSASPATAQALVSWTAPSSNGGSPLTGYTITVTPQGGSASQVAVNSGSASSAVVSGLTNGTSYTFTVAATNAIGTGTASSASAAITPNNTILDFPTPQTLDSGDATSVNLGIEFTASQNGSVTGVRFYKAAANTGTHVGSLWSSSGQLLAQGTFTNETASGWQTLVFSSPVSITAGSTYIASYLAPSGHFSMTRPGFSTALTNGPLTAPASTSTTYGNGVFAYSATSAFPTSSYQATDYGVDVLFNPGGGGTATVPGAPTGVSASPATAQALVSWTAPSSNGGSPLTGYTITVTPQGGSASQVAVNSGSASSAVVSGLTNGTSYTFTVAATNAIGTGTASSASAAITPNNTILDFPTPQTLDSGDATSVNLGIEFTASQNGSVTGVRFYKAAANTGTHVGSLWSSSGQLLAQGTFTNETASGWQTLVFSSPVSITAGSTYIASYLAPSGHFSMTRPGFSTALTNGPLTAPASTSTTYGNGVFAYSATSAFPTSSYQATDYGVDVLFNPGGGGTATVPGAPTGVSASPATAQALVSWTAPSSNGGSPLTGYTITVTPQGGSASQVAVNSGSASSAVVSGLTNGTSYTFTVAATNAIGTGTASSASAAITPNNTILDFPTPQTLDSGDATSVNLGIEFTASQNGSVTGVRFYKAAANTGTHVGSLWSSSGQLLAQGTFTNETASGWQTLVFSSPVSITAGSTYIASYLAPSGHFSMTRPGFSTALTNGPLTAPASTSTTYGNGVFAYSATSAFPTSSYQATDYGVDVLFNPGPPPPPPGQPTNVMATAGVQAATVSWSVPATGGAVSSYIITPYIGTTPQTETTVSGDSSSTKVTGLFPNQPYTFVVQAVNSSGSGPVSAPSNAVTPTAPTAPSAPQNVSATPASSRAQVSWTAPSSDGGSSITGYTITPHAGTTALPATQVNDAAATSAVVAGLTDGTAYTFQVTATNVVGTSPAATTPAVTPEDTIYDFSSAPQLIDSGDTAAQTVGVQFTSDSNGSIAGIRFYKAATNTGTHVGSLWTSTGQLLASATFTNETASGWQMVVFANPVAITPGTTYVASYTDPNGHESATPQGAINEFDNPPLHSLASGGVYALGPGNTFPTATFNNNNYYVDVLFSPAADALPGVPTNVTATPGYQGATVTWTDPGQGGSPITSYTITPYLGATAQTPTTVSGASVTRATIAGLSNGSAYTFTVAATNGGGTGPASAPSNSVTPGPEPQGLWSPLMNWPLVAVHSTLLSTGKVLTWDAWQQPEPSQEWDPSTNAFTTPINSPDSVFCSAMVQMPNGEILTAGGYGELSTHNLGIVDTTIYDPSTGSWKRMSDMHYARWYPGLTELANGTYVVISGNSTDGTTWADTPEVYDPTANTWTLLSNVNTSQIHELMYPNTYLLPNGNVFVLGEQEDVSYELNVPNQTWTQVGGSSGIHNGASVMYRPGKVLYAGGATSLTTSSPPQNGAATLDLTSANPQWQPTSPMAHGRVLQNMTVLADGAVLASGGQAMTAGVDGQYQMSGGVLPTEIWDPSTGTWTTAAPMAATRGYHTTTLLLPTGQVLVAGSGHGAPGYPGQYSAQIYSPPYLFKSARPTIASMPSTATYGSQITISTPDASSISQVNLVDLGSSTHQMNFDQHFVPLSFTRGSGQLTVTMPANGNFAPPANYMVFIVNSSGTPSVASMINLGASQQLPGSAQNVQAAPLNSTSALVTWSAATSSGSPVKSYAVTPYDGSTALRPTVVTGSPAAVRATVSGLKPGVRYRFTVTATNGKGAGRPSSRSNAVSLTAASSPQFVQKATAYADTSAALPLQLPFRPAGGDRLIVQTSVWGGSARAARVTDSGGDQFTEIVRDYAPDGTEMSVWTAPVKSGQKLKNTITVTPSRPADVGAVALEYSGLSTAAGTAAVDKLAIASGSTAHIATVRSGAVGAATENRELAVGLYADSGFGNRLHARSGWRERFNVSPRTTTMEQLVEDRIVGAGSHPEATVTTGTKTPWLMATILFLPADAHPSVRGMGGSAVGSRTANSVPLARSASSYAGVVAPQLEAAVPLSRRKRPHIVAGGIAEAFERGPDGRPVRFYCLVSSSGKLLPNQQINPKSVWWLPAAALK